jgi:stage III sporulation protein AE
MVGTVSGETGTESLQSLSGADINVTGESLTSALEPQRLLDDIAANISAGIPSALRLLGVIAGIIIISAVCNSMCEGLGTGGVSRGFGFLSAAVITAAIVGTQYSEIERALAYFERLGALMEAMIPVTGVVWAMGGGVMTASVGTAGLYALLAALQGVCASTVVPVCSTMCVSAICSGLSDGGLLNGFTGALKKTYNFVLGAIMTVLVFALGAQTAIAGAADTAAARGAKLISSTVIPVVGGAVGDTLRTVAGSVQYVKSVVGVGGIVLVLYLTLPTFISILMTRLVMLIGASVAQMLGCKRENRLLDELGNIYGCLLGAVSISAVAFCVALAIFVKCTVAAA